MPKIGLGAWSLKRNEIVNAIKEGYRLIDTAAEYGNENEVGEAIKISGIKRNEIFIVTKLWTADIRNRQTRKAFFNSLKKLQTNYIDLYLIHWPAEGYEEAWLEMEKLYYAGFIRALGVSNFDYNHLLALKKNDASVIPAVNQMESHIYFKNKEIIEDCKRMGIIPQAWCPLGANKNNELNDPVVKELADKYKKSPSQIILKWHLKDNVAIIPRTKKINNLKSNLAVSDFDLEDGDIKKLDELNKNQRLGPNPQTFNF